MRKTRAHGSGYRSVKQTITKHLKSFVVSIPLAGAKKVKKVLWICCVVQKLCLTLQPISRHMSCWRWCSCVSQVKSVTLDRWNFDVKAMMLSAWQSSVGRYKTSETPDNCSTLLSRWASHTGGDECPLHVGCPHPEYCAAPVFFCVQAYITLLFPACQHISW